VEEVLVGVFKGKTIGESIPSIGGGSLSGIFFVGIILSIALIPFFAFREIGRVIGTRELHARLFGRQVGPRKSAYNGRRKASWSRRTRRWRANFD
jgi:hypothetical protein